MNDPIQNEGETLRAAAANTGQDNTGQDNAGQEHASQGDIVTDTVTTHVVEDEAGDTVVEKTVAEDTDHDGMTETETITSNMGVEATTEVVTPEPIQEETIDVSDMISDENADTSDETATDEDPFFGPLHRMFADLIGDTELPSL